MSAPTRDDVIRMAQEAGWEDIDQCFYAEPKIFERFVERMERFAALVESAERIKHAAEIKSLGEAITRQHEAAEQLAARVMKAEDGIDEAVAAEREACAKLCDARSRRRDIPMQRAVEASSLADAIRARGKA